ncbi:MAG TPA: DUF3300 domain-containing protein [Alphaproteobacteria bacterium]|nr:DUF3300 domain-containing protein [Alphaproteobacteria bacterium]
MTTSLVRAIAGALAILALMSAPIFPQYTRASAQTAPLYAPEQLDQMLSPIALYPDPLLAQILMAATYPLEVVAAAQWVQDPQNASLRGDALAAAAQNQNWDPSVISLVPFPQILQMMSSKLDWLQALGNAFLAQQADVMDSVQRLRRAAQAAGTLAPGPQANVVYDGPTIEIQPADPNDVYIPCYNPAYAYGAWPYSGYQPVFSASYYGCTPGPTIGYYTPIPVIGAFWGWDRWEWRNHRIFIDADRYNRIDRDRRHFTGDTWTHDPYHRRGVAYGDPGTRARFAPTQANLPAPSRDIRGFPSAPGGAAAPAAPGGARPGQPGPAGARPTLPGAAPSAPGASRPPAPPSAPALSQPGRAAPTFQAPSQPTRAAPTFQAPSQPARAAPTFQAPSQPARAAPTFQAPTQTRPSPPAFNATGNGAAVRAQSARGQSSLQAAPSRPAAPSVQAPPRGAPSAPRVSAPPSPGNAPRGAPQPPGKLPHP